MHVILPHQEEFTPADLREGRASYCIIRNNAIKECAERICLAGGTVSYETAINVIHLEDGLRVNSPR